MANSSRSKVLHDRSLARYTEAYRDLKRKTVNQCYNALESRIGYALLLGRVKHWPSYPPGTWWPYPVAPAHRAMEDRLAGALDLPQGSQVLDTGCGDGYVAMYLTKSRGWLVEGIDINDYHLAKARKNFEASGIPGNTVRSMDYENMQDIPDNTYDGAYAMETFIHASEPNQAVAEVFRILKPGGVFVFHDYEQAYFAADEVLRAQNKPSMGATDKDEMIKSGALLASYGATPAWHKLVFGFWASTLAEVGFEEVQDLDLAGYVTPMAFFFYLLAFIPYYCVIRPLGLEWYFLSVTSMVHAWSIFKLGLLSYRQFKGKKPAAAK